MNVLDIIGQRREITSFRKEAIHPDILEQLLEAGYLAPSGNNLPSREFILVTKRGKLDELAETTPYVQWLYEATAAIVITGRPNISKYWLQDASIAAGFIWLTATDLGLGAAFGAVYHSEDQIESKRREDLVCNGLNIPNDRRIIAIIGLGYPQEKPQAKKQLSRDQVVYYERFSN